MELSDEDLFAFFYERSFTWSWVSETMQHSPTRKMLGWLAVVVGLCLFAGLVVAPLINPSITGWQQFFIGLGSLPLSFRLVEWIWDSVDAAADKRAQERFLQVYLQADREYAEHRASVPPPDLTTRSSEQAGQGELF